MPCDGQGPLFALKQSLLQPGLSWSGLLEGQAMAPVPTHGNRRAENVSKLISVADY